MTEHTPPPFSLPIDQILADLCSTLAEHSRCLLIAQPGAGKTTRVPLALLAATEGRWLLLEPRRVAARLAAVYMAEQLGEAPGQTVGYRVRGDSRVSKHTRLEVVTQGILTRMLQEDPLLEGITGIIFDEFHERSLDADLGLALTLDVQQGLRSDLKVVVMSATLDTQALLETLGKATPVLECAGRAWPVSTYYRPPPLRSAAELHQSRVVREALDAHEGHLLVFLPGQREILRLQRSLAEQLDPEIEVLPLHGQLPLAQQQAVLRPPREQRRVILSTAIAESSLTVPGVRIVIDAGRERVPVFRPQSGLTQLLTRPVNRASADQRRGRAGREAAGFCYRLWSEEQLLIAHREAEILQADLSGLIFELVRWGVSADTPLPWVTAPPTAALASGRQLLLELGLLQSNEQLTALGRRCTRWPCHPRLAVLFDHAQQHAQLPLACWLASWLEEAVGGNEDIHEVLEQRPRQDGKGSQGRWWRAAKQWSRRADCQLSVDDTAAAAELLARAFPDRIAQQQGEERFKLISGGQAQVSAKSSLATSPYIVAVEVDGQASRARIFHAIALPASALTTLFPASQEWQEDIRWDEEAGRLVGEAQQRLGELILARQPLASLPPAATQQAIISALRQRGSLPWSEEDRQLLGRLRLLRQRYGEDWPDTRDSTLLAELERWLSPYLTGITRLEQVARLPLGQYLVDTLLPWPLQQTLQEEAPTHFTVPSGMKVRIDYGGDEPVLAVKLQALFGLRESPRLAGGRVPLVIHLLSPAGRPVQITRDLASFWASTYFDVRRDLKGRYPKHPWPEDPLTATATHHTKKRAQENR